MEAPLRRQHRSCDQCRKGKRACDGKFPEDLQGISPTSRPTQSLNAAGELNIRAPSPCSNCKKWDKECTFNWLYITLKTPKERRKRRKPKDVANAKKPSVGTTSFNPYLQPYHSFMDSSNGVLPFPIFDQYPLPHLGQTGAIPEVDMLGISPWDTHMMSGIPVRNQEQVCSDISLGDISQKLHHGEMPSDVMPGSFEESTIAASRPYEPNLSQNGFPLSGNDDESQQSNDDLINRFLDPNHNLAKPRRTSETNSVHSLLSPSNDLAESFSRSTLTQNMFRIYHDSMENALSCWLTEQNCPYSVTTSPRSPRNNPLFNAVEKEWGPNWSNRICTRVCKLDRASSSVWGRSLTATEEKAVSQALLTTIMAFASQWTHDSQERAAAFKASPPALDTDSSQSYTNGSVFSDTSNSDFDWFKPLPNNPERSIQDNLWNKARHALESAVGISSFRLVFANLIFSLTQRPLNVKEHLKMMNTSRSIEIRNGGQGAYGVNSLKSSALAELHELFDNDCAPLFLETAVRQLFSFRYKMTMDQRKKPKSSGGGDNILPRWSAYNTPPSSNSNQRQGYEPGISDADQKVLSPEDNETFNLLFWLSLMFDTLTAAMHQRPPVVSDEDSEIRCVTPLSRTTDTNREEQSSLMDRAEKKKQELWGDLFLRKSAVGQGANIPRWPCSYKDAAETLSDAAPVKVLLFRRVSHLQTLLYRGASARSLEEAIQNTFWVYQHWNSTYRRFMLDCMRNHDDLPPRIQSWYVILAGHWHLATMLLADTLESIDEARLGLDSQRESRRAMDLVATLRRENALAVSNIAQCSLHGRDPSFAKARQFHDSVNEGAFLTEPWTAVLIRSFTKAAYILLDEVDNVVHLGNYPSEQSWRQCRFCLDALWCLGRKSDMALLAARVLSNSIEERLKERQSQNNNIAFPAYLTEDYLTAVPNWYDYDTPISSLGAVF